MTNFNFDTGIMQGYPLEVQARKYGYTLNGLGKILDESAYCLNVLYLSRVLTDDEYTEFSERLNVTINKKVIELPYPREKESHDVYYIVFKCGKCGKKYKLRITDGLPTGYFMKYLKMWGSTRCDCGEGYLFFADVEKKYEYKR